MAAAATTAALPASPPPITKFATLAASTLLDACSGLSYSFAVWAPHARDRLSLSQAQIAAAGAALNLGGYFALPAGWLYDRLAHLPATGPRAVLWVGALTAALGYSGLWALASGRLLGAPASPSSSSSSSSSAYPLLLLLAALAGNSGVWLDASVLVTNVRNFPSDRGTVVGFLKAFLGLSASLWALPYAALLAPDVDAYLLLLAVAPAVVIVAASLLVNHVPFVEACELEEAGGAAAGGRGGGDDDDDGAGEAGGSHNQQQQPPKQQRQQHHYTLIFPSAPSSSSLPLSLRLRQARRRLAQRLRRALYLPPGRRFRAMFALVALLAVLNTLVALALHHNGGDDEEEEGGGSSAAPYDDDEEALQQHKRRLFAVATLALGVVSAAPWLTSGARLRAEPAGGAAGGGGGASTGGVELTTAAKAAGAAAGLAAASSSSDPEDGRRLLSPDGKAGAAAAAAAAGGSGAGAADAPPPPPPAASHQQQQQPPPSSSAASTGLFAALRTAGSPDGALLLLQFAVVSGACLAFLNNLGEIYRSLEAAAALEEGGEASAPQAGGHVVFVSLFSVANAAGRLAGGAAPEAALRSRGAARPLYLAATTALVAVASALTAAGVGAFGTGALALLSACFGFGFGATWSLVPAVLADVFGLQAFAQNYAVAQLAPASGSYLLASGLTGRMYDAAAREQQWEREQQQAASAASSASSSSSSSSAAAAADLLRAAAGKAQQALFGGKAAAAPAPPAPPRCVGAPCFSTAFWLLAALCVGAALSTMVLARRTRALYQSLGRELRAAHAARRRRGASLRATGGGGAAEAEGAGGTGGGPKKLVLEEEDL